MKKLITASLVTVLCLFTFGAPSCRDANGQKIKPSQAVVLAQNFASIPVGFRVTGEITEVLTTDGDFSVESRDAVRHGLKNVLTKLDQVAADIESGKYDAATVKAKVNLALNEFEKAIKDGSAGIKNPQAQQRWLAYTMLARMAFVDISRLVEALKPLPPAIASDQQKTPQQLPLTASGLAQIINYSVIAALDIKTVRDDTSVASLWEKYRTFSTAAHEALK